MGRKTTEELHVAVAHMGARRHYAVPVAFYRAGLLAAFYTELCDNVGVPRLVSKIMPACLQTTPLKRLKARHVPEIPCSKIRCFWPFGLWRLLRRRLARSPLSRAKMNLWAGETFCRKVVAACLGKANSVYTMSGTAL